MDQNSQDNLSTGSLNPSARIDALKEEAARIGAERVFGFAALSPQEKIAALEGVISAKKSEMMGSSEEDLKQNEIVDAQDSESWEGKDLNGIVNEGLQDLLISSDPKDQDVYAWAQGIDINIDQNLVGHTYIPEQNQIIFGTGLGEEQVSAILRMRHADFVKAQNINLEDPDRTVDEATGEVINLNEVDTDVPIPGVVNASSAPESTQEVSKTTVDISDESKTVSEDVKDPAAGSSLSTTLQNQNASTSTAPALASAPASAPVPAPALQDPNSAPAPFPVTVPAPVEQVNAKSETWERMEKIRDDLIRLEIENKKNPKTKHSGRSGLSIAQLNGVYMDAMKDVGEEIRNKLREERVYGPLTPADTQKLEEEINAEVLEKIFKSENQVRSQIKEQIEGPDTNKALEMLRKAAQSRIGQKYLSMNKWVRLGATTALLGTVGYAAGTIAAGAAVSWGAARILRGAVSIAAGGAARAAADAHWTDEKVEKKYAEEKRKAMNSVASDFESKYKKIKELETKENKDKKKQKIYKAGVTVGVGMGSGLLMSLAEGGVFGKGANVIDHKLGARKGIDPSEHKGASPTKDMDLSKPKAPPVDQTKPSPLGSKVGEEPLDAPPIEKPVQEVPETHAPKASELTNENLPVSKEFLQPMIHKGDSTWTLVKGALNHNEEFEKLSEAKKTFVLSTLTQKAIESPEKYGLTSDAQFGIKLEVGKQLDLTKLLGDKKDFVETLLKAQKLRPVDEQNILETNLKIEKYLDAHPDEPMTNEVVDKITGSEISGEESTGAIPYSSTPETDTSPDAEAPTQTETKVENFSVAEPQFGVSAKMQELQEKIGSSTILKKLDANELADLENRLKILQQKAKVFETLDKNSANYAEESIKIKTEVENLEIDVANIIKKLIGMNGTMGPKDAVASEILAQSPVNKHEIMTELEVAKARLKDLQSQDVEAKPFNADDAPVNELAKSRSIVDPMPIRTMTGDTEIMSQINKALIDEVNEVYSQKGWFKTTLGVNTEEWGFMRKLPAAKLVDYATRNSRDSGLSKEVIYTLEKVKTHQKMIGQIKGLLEMTGGIVKPHQNENVEAFIRRLGERVYLSHINTDLKRAA